MNIRSFSILLLCTVLLTASCSLEKRRYSRGFTINRQYVPLSGNKRAVKKNPELSLKSHPLRELVHPFRPELTKTDVRPKRIVHNYETYGQVRKSQTSHKLSAIKKKVKPLHIKPAKRETQNSRAVKSRHNGENKTQVAGVLFMLIMAVLMACLALVFFVYLGVIGIIFLVIFGIAAIILFIAALVAAIVQ